MVNIRREAVIAKREISNHARKRPMVYALRCAKFPRAKRTECTSDHPPRYGLLLRSDRGAGSAFAAGQTRRRGRRTRAPRRFDHLQLRGAKVRCSLCDADVHGHAGRMFAWKKSQCIGHSVLRNGRRIRRTGRKIRSIAPSRATLARSNRQSAPGDRSNRVRHKLPPSNHRPNESPAKTHGRNTCRSFVVENPLRFRWRRGFRSFTGFRWRTAPRRAASRNVFVRRTKNVMLDE